MRLRTVSERLLAMNQASPSNSASCVVIGAAWRLPSSAVETNMQVRTSFMIDWTVSSDSGLDAALVVCV